MTPGPTIPVDPNAKLDADHASLQKNKKENEAKLAQAEAQHKELQNECFRIFIYENPTVAAEFTAYFTGSENIELEQLVKYQQAQLTAFERRKALASEFIKRCGASKVQNKDSDNTAKKALEKSSEEKHEKSDMDSDNDATLTKKYRSNR